MLYHLVESSLPEEKLHVWKRSRAQHCRSKNNSNNNEKPVLLEKNPVTLHSTDLDNLFIFLIDEI